MGEPKGLASGRIFSKVRPDETVGFARLKPAYLVGRKLGNRAQRRHVSARAAGVILPSMIRTLDAASHDPALRQRHIAVRATVFKSNRFSISAKENHSLPVKVDRQRV